MSILNGSVDLYVVLKNAEKLTGDEILRILEGEIDLNERYDKVGDTVYHVILKNKQLKNKEGQIITMCRIFRDRGVDPATINRNGKAPLHLAIENRMKDVVDFFMNYNPGIAEYGHSLTKYFVGDENKQFWQQARQNYNNLKYWASEEIENKSASFLVWLIQNQYNCDSEIDIELEVLHLAIDCNLQHILPVLLKCAKEKSINNPEHEPLLHLFLKKSGFKRNSLNECDSKDWYYQYTSRYTATIVKILFDRGAVVNDYTIQLATKGREEIAIIKMLVDRLPCDCDKSSFPSILNELMRYTDFDDLIDESYLKILRDLVAKGANVDEADASEITPVQVAFETKNICALLWLMDVGADLTVLTKDGENLLHLLIAKKWGDDVQEAMLFNLLVSKGCDVNKKDNRGTTPLQLAMKLGNKALVRKLIEHGAQINCRDKDMRTPLHYAVMDADPVELVELLLEKGANANARDIGGERPLFLVISTAERKVDEDPLCVIPRYVISTYVDHLGKKISMIKMLLKWGTQVNTLHSISDTIVLERICTNDSMNADVVKEFLAYGLKINDSPFCRSLFWRCHRKTLALLVEQCIRLKAAKLPYPEEYENNIRGYDNQQFYQDCLKEIENLKSTFIDSNTSLYDLLHMNLNSRRIYTYNERLQQLLQSSTFETQFPEYSILILANYNDDVTRKSLIELAKIAWVELTEISLPEICIEHIFSFLSNTDLVDIIETDYKSKAEQQHEAADKED